MDYIGELVAIVLQVKDVLPNLKIQISIEQELAKQLSWLQIRIVVMITR